MSNKPIFSVILATRNRPELFAEALQSVLDQDYPQFEVIVVNDGSAESTLSAYRNIWDKATQVLGDRFAVHNLVYRPRGHGPSYSVNFGVAQAKGNYICFLDDDDKWTDSGHLSRAGHAILSMSTQEAYPVDLYMGNQQAWTDKTPVRGPVWLEGLAEQLLARGKRPLADGSYVVDTVDLMAAAGFCHLNCLTVRRALYEEVGGMDEGIRWEQDRDIYLRLVDSSRLMLHHPNIMSFHRVPNPNKNINITTSMGTLEKLLQQIRVLDKNALFAKHQLIRAYARKHKAYALKKVSQQLAKKQMWTAARFYAAQALGASPNIRWAMFTVYCFTRSLGRRDPHGRST